MIKFLTEMWLGSKDRAKYLLWNTDRKNIGSRYFDHGWYECLTFQTKKEAVEYLEEEVSKANRKYWKMYELTNLKGKGLDK